MNNELLESSFDFSIRLIELIKYLQGEGKAFPLSERLLLCGSGIGVNLRLSALFENKERLNKQWQALYFATESAYILELMAKTGYLTEAQSRPIRTDCDELKQAISSLLKAKK